MTDLRTSAKMDRKEELDPQQRLLDLEAELALRHSQLDDVRQRAARLDAELQAAYASRSWRLTRPLRALVNYARLGVRLAKEFGRQVRMRGVVRVLRTGLRHLRAGGLEAVVSRVEQMQPEVPVELAYPRWIEHQDRIDERELREYGRSSEKDETSPVRFSIIMPTFNTSADFLRCAIDSVQKQVYPHWELCIADDASTQAHVREILAEAASSDPRIKFIVRSENGHICSATNSAIELATGEFIALLDHDDEMHPMALYWAAKELKQYPDTDLIYTDEDKIAPDGRREGPYFKCDFNYELMLSQNMVSHLGIYRLDVVRQVGGLRPGFEGAQDYDLALRVFELVGAARVRHIPKVLYHWRVHPESTAGGSDAKPYAFLAACRSVSEHLQRIGLSGDVVEAPEAPAMLRVRLALPTPKPSVDIVIPTRDRADLMRVSVGTVLEKTQYPNFRIIIVDNGSIEKETLELFDRWRSNPRIKIIRDDSAFNFSKLNNLAVAGSNADMICMLNNDIEAIDGYWLEEMVMHACRHDVGCVGARLWYPNGTLQHGGVVLGMGGVAGHAHKHLIKGRPGYFGRAVLLQSFSAVTAACLLVRREIFNAVGGLDERLGVAFNDVDFCLRVREAGYRNVWTPYAELVHHESLSRGYEDTPEKAARFAGEVRFMQTRWAGKLSGDPCYSPNLSLRRDDFTWDVRELPVGEMLAP